MCHKSCLCPCTTHTCVWNSSVISVQVRPRSHRVVNRRLVDVYRPRESRCARQTQQCEQTSSCYLRQNKLRVRRSLNLNVCLRKISIYSGSKSILVWKEHPVISGAVWSDAVLFGAVRTRCRAGVSLPPSSLLPPSLLPHRLPPKSRGCLSHPGATFLKRLWNCNKPRRWRSPHRQTPPPPRTGS